MKEFNGIISKARRQAKDAGLSKNDIKDAVEKIRGKG